MVTFYIPKDSTWIIRKWLKISITLAEFFACGASVCQCNICCEWLDGIVCLLSVFYCFMLKIFVVYFWVANHKTFLFPQQNYLLMSDDLDPSCTRSLCRSKRESLEFVNIKTSKDVILWNLSAPVVSWFSGRSLSAFLDTSAGHSKRCKIEHRQGLQPVSLAI